LTATVRGYFEKAGPCAPSIAHWLMSFWLLLPLFLLFSQIGFYWVRMHTYAWWVVPISRLQPHQGSAPTHTHTHAGSSTNKQKN